MSREFARAKCRIELYKDEGITLHEFFFEVAAVACMLAHHPATNQEWVDIVPSYWMHRLVEEISLELIPC
jgi:hypothetical protein